MIKQANEEHGGNSDTAMQVKAENFRPNLIVSGVTNALVPHSEDQWKDLLIPLNSSSTQEEEEEEEFVNTKFKISGPCSRCSMVNVNGQRGIMDCRVFEALSEYRKYGSSVYFGQFVTLENEVYRNSNSIVGIMKIGAEIQYFL
jgi:uncharacterized protein YcbX